MRRLVCLLVCAAALSSCVGPARTDAVYEGKAVETAKAVRSAIETARLAASTAPDNATGQYLSVVLADSEEEADASAGAFDSIQPPTDRSETLHDELSAVIEDALTILRELRIAVRGTELGALKRGADRLASIGRALESFVEEHE
ncbi:MAG: hypothetical protein WAT66_04265 [Actinomycetota bacterium]